MDKLILGVLKKKTKYRELKGSVPTDTIGTTTEYLLKLYDIYFKRNPEASEVDFDALESIVRLKAPTPEAATTSLQALEKAREVEVTAQQEEFLTQQLQDMEFAGKAARLVNAYNDGEDVDLSYELYKESTRIRQLQGATEASKFEAPDVHAILDEQARDVGLKFRQQLLQEGVKGLVAPMSIAICAGVDSGKCLAKGTGVILADGRTVPVEDIKVGDVLAGPHMNNTVQGVTSGVDNMYKVTYPWGESYTVNSEHLLSLQYANKEHRVVKVSDYFNNPGQNRRNSSYKGWKSGIDLPEADLWMPPYLLGLWLGDGISSKPGISTMDLEVVEAFNDYYGEYSAKYSKPNNKASTYVWYYNSLLTDLREVGVLNNKHIPEVYLRSSVVQRKELLAGLIDSDGYLANNVQLVTKYDHLADQITWLARSLGIHATKRSVWKKCPGMAEKREYYEVNIGAEFYDMEMPLRIERRLDIYRAKAGGKRKRHGLNFGILVEEVGVGEYAGFSLDGDHLFLLADFTVTHNTSYISDTLTYMAPQAAKMYPGRPIIWFSNEGVSREIWPRLYSAALGKTGKELAEMPPEKLYKEYAKALGGDMNLIKLRDAHGWGLSQVAAVVEEMKPCIVVFDMIANFKSSVVTLHEKMESNLQEVREMAAIHDFIAISTVQLSVEGYNNLYPPMTALKESKVGIQGALDVQIMMGRLNDDTYANIRGISTPKNKRKMPGKPTCVKGEVVFYPDKCRFVDN